MYTDSQFNTPVLVPAVGLLTASLTGTGTAVTGLGTVQVYPPFIRRTLVKGIQILIVTAANAALNPNLVFTNGTNALGTATLGTATAGQVFTITPTANNTFAAAAGSNTILTTLVGTATSAGTAGGIYAVWLDTQELYA